MVHKRVATFHLHFKNCVISMWLLYSMEKCWSHFFLMMLYMQGSHTEYALDAWILSVAYPGIFFGGKGGGGSYARKFFEGGSTNSVEACGQREWGSGGSSPLVPLNFQMSETRILSRLLGMYIPRNWEFGSALSKLWNFEGRGWNPPLLLGTPLNFTGLC
jgi:hypothetical protein